MFTYKPEDAKVPIKVWMDKATYHSDEGMVKHQGREQELDWPLIIRIFVYVTRGAISTPEEEIEVLIPDTWEEVTLEMFLDILKAENSVDVLSALTRLDNF